MGIGIGFGNPDKARRITLKNPDGSTATTISFHSPSKKKLKKLNYNFKEISGQILRAKTCMSAKQVAVRARSKAAILRRQLKCGVYDDMELEHAILHADQMVRIAKKRMKHLQEEERAGKNSSETVCEAEMEEKTETISLSDMEQDSEKIRELIREMQDMLEQLDFPEELEELSGITAYEDMDPADLELMKKKHRADELREIAEADMRYLKAFFSRLEKERREASGSGSNYNNGNGVSLEISGMEIPVAPMEQPVLAEGGCIDMKA